jgi:hypothetical protein
MKKGVTTFLPGKINLTTFAFVGEKKSESFLGFLISRLLWGHS